MILFSSLSGFYSFHLLLLLWSEVAANNAKLHSG